MGMVELHSALETFVCNCRVDRHLSRFETSKLVKYRQQTWYSSICICSQDICCNVVMFPCCLITWPQMIKGSRGGCRQLSPSPPLKVAGPRGPIISSNSWSRRDTFGNTRTHKLWINVPGRGSEHYNYTIIQST